MLRMFFAWCRGRGGFEPQVWGQEWVYGQLWLLPMSNDKEWLGMYLVTYLGVHSSIPQFERSKRSVSKHNVHFWGSPHVRAGKMPKDPPLLFPAFLSQVDFRNGHPRILFTKKHESCSPYTGIVTERDLLEAERVFDDGSQPFGQEGRRLTQDSWNRVLKLAEKHKRSLSFNLE